jgi:hypothetical protein
MGLKSHHIVPNSERGGWDVKKNNAERASLHTDSKKEAIDKGREISQSQRSELFIHNKDGRIASRDSHGNDPNPPKG